jgi:uncharacterized membrane protein YqjE
MRGSKIATIVLAIADAVVWGTPAAIYSALWIYQYAQGRGSLLLFAIAPALYCVGLLLSVGSPIILYRSERFVAAIAVAGIFLVLGLLVGVWGILMLGST